MKAIEATININSSQLNQDKQINAIQLWLASMRFNGQILGTQQIITQKNDQYYIYISAPEKDSLNMRYANEHVKQRHNELYANEMGSPKIRIINDDLVGMRPCKCSDNSFFILYTNCFSIESPIRCGDCFNPIPLYRLPPLDEVGYESLLNWQYTYQAFDQIFINSGIGENFALRQLSGANSQLTKDGLFFCEEIFEKTEIKTLYYLLQYSSKEDDMIIVNNCPLCKNKWRLDKKLFNKLGSKCDNCSLISN